jgi:MFS family permease
MTVLVRFSGAARVLAVAQLANAIGDGAYIVCSVLYFTRIVGLSATQLGVGLTAGWAAGFVAGVPLGHLADRWGPRRTAVALALGTSLSVGSFLVVRGLCWPLAVTRAARPDWRRRVRRCWPR